MAAEPTVPVVLFVLGGLFIGWAGHSLRTDSPLRRLYGVAPTDDHGVRANAAAVGACGLGLLLLAGAIAAGVPDRLIGTGAVLAGGLGCVLLGWLVRYRDRRALLTTPGVDRPTARRLGGAVMACGLVSLPLALAIWVHADTAVIVTVALGGSVVSLLIVAFAYR